MVRGGLNIVFICHVFHFTQRVASIPTSCLYVCAYWCVCLQGCHCNVCVLFDVMFSASVLVFVVCSQFQSCLVVVLAIGSSHVFDFCLHSYRPWIKNAVSILRTAKTESSAETTISCHVCD